MINSIEYSDLKFNIIEKNISDFLHEIGSDILRKILQGIDDELFSNRDKSIYRYKEKRECSINTCFGNVTYNRRYYKEKVSRCESRAVFLLDEVLDIDILGRSTIKQAVNLAIEAEAKSFRDVSRKNDNLMNGNPSHQTVKNHVSRIGKLLECAEMDRVQKYLNNELEGKKQVEILFEEKDGLFISIQGEKHKKEIKLAKVYEGWQHETVASKRYKTVNTLYFAGYHKPEEFDSIINSRIAQIYDMDYLKTKILNGDGAEWISKEVEEDASVQYQLDLFHIYQKAARKISNLDERKKIKKLIKDKKFSQLIDECKKLYEAERDEKEKEKLREVYIYYENNKDALVRYRDRENFNLETDQELKDLGTMEGSVHNVLATRMKGHGLSWSMTGADAMAKLLCLKHSQIDLLSEIESIIKRKINMNFECNVKNKLDNELKKAKKDINDAVRGILYEKSSKFSNKESHIRVFDNKLTQLFRTLRSLL
jgi:hypothetical protein